jgi:hypothetical protein
MQESKFDQYLGHELKRLAFVSGGTFKITDIKEHLMKSDRDFLTKLTRRRILKSPGTGIASQIG